MRKASLKLTDCELHVFMDVSLDFLQTCNVWLIVQLFYTHSIQNCFYEFDYIHSLNQDVH